MTFLQALGHFIATPKKELVLPLMNTDFLFVLKIKPYVEELSLKFSGQIQDGIYIVGYLYDFYNSSSRST